MRAPAFWQQNGWLPTAFAPAACAWTAVARFRQRTAHPVKVSVPVICVGNVTAGGAGKTPTVLALLAALRARARSFPAHVLSRGYGGRLQGPVRADPDRHGADEVGDEALLLARAAPTWVARDRRAGAEAAIAAGAKLLILDDGFQSPSLAKDLSLLAIDGGFGFGNGRAMPAGPLREPIADALARADGSVLVGEDRAGVTATIRNIRPDLRVLAARLVPDANAAATLKGQRVVAFAGIGRPEKFFSTLAEIGAEIVGRHGFADHYPFRTSEIAALEAEARAENARLVTTEKDHVRLPPDARARIAALPVALAFADSTVLDRLLAPVLEHVAVRGALHG
ncbi:MAG TPA: tetraacyldisaccharide 4'-kinase [Alphaproteobacteria bacterium]|nr:tetraacyldisaccharide 4'-kinase [Alphaproteobacteria bacterium]